MGHSVQMKENHNSMDYLLSAVNYHEHKWLIYGDLKVVRFGVRFQGGYKIYPCFLCLWDSRADHQHYVRQEWPLRQRLKHGSYIVQSHTIVETNKIHFK